MSDNENARRLEFCTWEYRDFDWSVKEFEKYRADWRKFMTHLHGATTPKYALTCLLHVLHSFYTFHIISPCQIDNAAKAADPRATASEKCDLLHLAAVRAEFSLICSASMLPPKHHTPRHYTTKFNAMTDEYRSLLDAHVKTHMALEYENIAMATFKRIRPADEHAAADRLWQDCIGKFHDPMRGADGKLTPLTPAGQAYRALFVRATEMHNRPNTRHSKSPGAIAHMHSVFAAEAKRVMMPIAASYC